MGIENMRRWPVYIVFAVCIMLLLSLFNSWSVETELRNRSADLRTQLQECSKQQTSCMEESLTLLEQRDGYVVKVNELDKQRVKMIDDVAEFRTKLTKAEGQVNETKVEIDMCNTELQSYKNLQASKKALLETMKIEKDSLTAQLSERKQKIESLEKEILQLKSTLTTKSGPNPAAMSKVTPAAQPPKISEALSANKPVYEQVLGNDAKEDIEDTNALNDGINFDT